MQRLWFLLGILLIFSAAPAATAQDVPPQVIGLQPFPGEEISPGAPLTVIFNQPMDRASVEGAFSLAPDVSGAFDWPDDDTLVFTPSASWTDDIALTVGESAAAQNGLMLAEAYEATLRAMAPLMVGSTVPSDGAEGVAADATITVAFNRPVVPLGSTEDLAALPSPLTISPEINGSGTWLNTSIYQFTPGEDLLGGATYTVTVNAGLTAVSGATLDAPYTFRFATLAPEILSTNPTQGATVRLEAPVIVNFSQPMNRAMTEAGFSLLANGQSVDGLFIWENDDRTLKFQPNERLPIATSMRLVVDANIAQGLGGATLREGRDFTFQTMPLPFVEFTRPNNGENNVTPGFRRVTIRFGTPMNTETFADRYQIRPQPEEVRPVVFGEQDLGLEFEFEPNTRYTVTLLAGAEDVYGNAIPNDFQFSFNVGEVQPEFYIQDDRGFRVTGSYRNDTALIGVVTGQPQVDFKLYESPLRAVPAFARYLSDDAATEVIGNSTLIREWQESFPNGGFNAEKKINLVSDQGGVLPLGNYMVTAVWDPSTALGRLFNNSRPPRNYYVGMAVVNTNVTVKRSEDALLAWVTDMQTAEPVVEQSVTMYDFAGNPVVTGFTDADGVVRFDGQFPGEIVIAAESETRYGVWYTGGVGTTPTQDLYLYTDRPIYRPGETLYFRGVYRTRDDFDFRPSDLASVSVVIRDTRGQELFNDEVQLTAFGSFSGDLPLPDDAAVGPLNIEVRAFENYLGGSSAQIAEFRVPEFSVSVTPALDEIIGGEPLRAIIGSTFFSGGAVNNAPVTWIATAVQTSFNYTGPGRYSFSDNTNRYLATDAYIADFDPRFGGGFGGRTIANGEGTTDADGELLVEIEETQPQGNQPETITIEATLNDESGQFISGRSSVTVHPAEVYVGVRTEQYFASEGEPFTAEIITVTPDSEAVMEQNATLTLVERRWEREEIEGQFGRYEWTQREIEVESVQVTTDDTGRASHAFTPPNPGIFLVRASTFDRLERTHTSAVQIYVTGSGRVWWGEPTNNIDLIPDQDSYTPGETAQILVPISLEGVSYVLVAVEREGVMTYEVVRVEGSTLVYDLPITTDFEPGIFLNVMVVHGIDEDNSTPTFRQGQVRLDVEPVSKALNVEITPSTSNAQPGDTVTFDVLATDPEGDPVQAEFGLALVDEAILSLAAPNSIDPLDHYYSQVSNFTNTEIMLTALIDRRIDEIFGSEPQAEDPDTMMDDGMALGGAAVAEMEEISADFAAAPMEQARSANLAAPTATSAMMDEAGPDFDAVEVRENFQQTPLWEAHVVTDANGRAQVEVTMPDNLTVWDLTARAITLDTKVGSANIEVSSTLPLLVRPATPRFFVVGDEVSLAMVVNNNSDEPQDVAVTMQGEGFELMDGESLEQARTIEPNGRVRYEWRVEIPDVESVDLTFVAVGADGFQDASKPPLATGPDGTIPVYRYTAPDTVGTGGVLREAGSRTEGISIPPIADTDQGTLTVQLDPSLAVTTVDALDYLKNFEHQCIEQTVSRFLPNVVTYRALQQLGVDDPELKAQLDTQIEFALTRLRATQNGDGGWGWFPGMESNPLVTAYAVYGLIEAQQAGYSVELDMINRGAQFVRTQFINPTEDTEPYLLNRQAFYFFVLTRTNDGYLDPSAGELDALFRVRLEMNYDAISYLLMAYNALQSRDMGVQGQIEALRTDLISGAKLSATGAHWEESYRDWWNWGSEVRSTSLALAALIETEPQNELLPNAVRWLMVARQGKHWETTQETAWAVMALTDWMVATNELDGNYDYTLALNGGESTSGTVTPETVRDGEELVFAVGDLLMEEINRLTVIRGEGDGALYYTAHLQMRLDANEVSAIDRGVGVQREYLMDDEPVDTVQMGDTVTVRITMTVPETVYYFVLEDPLPAGLEALDTSLLTTTQTVEGPQLRLDRDPYYYWWWWIWDHTEIRDESVNLYADRLPPGTYVYSYQAQATTPGAFQAMPSHGYAFYFPEVFGRSDGALFTVENLPEE